ncbi:16S rRNA (guanine(527)-N(7))-methyltransferase RsmG [Methylomonas rhizoryzae]|uniref:16S rRNA (guanine(527)-N(7))-methyltransferase RsmG n=1 Tax=Methylomonas rhizoryzae TaxID=2608981 RepID=UPI001232BE3A|nr:16S rRNA (guanine(527)-N(7))-methyltransferase RsmG [Methylomonas rhizoryzae]
MTACRVRLADGLAALGLSLSERQQTQLYDFVKLIEKWNKAYNLTAVRDPLQMVDLHILDSLTVLPHLKPPKVADVGTGAGLPGIPLAICLPEFQFVLIDTNSKKTRFVRQAVLELKLRNVEVVHGRVEELRLQPLCSTVICRAFAAMSDILKLSGHLLAENGVLLAMKGQLPEDELIMLNSQYAVLPLSVPGVEAERCLIRLEKAAHG